MMLTTSPLDASVMGNEQFTVNSFLSKPVTFAGLAAAMSALGRYWLEIVELPPVPA
jgi:hypothetical protein